MKDGLLTAGAFARLHRVNKRTLHYYDEIGLFRPQVRGENGYRYYTYLQGAAFEMILALRELGVSVEDIAAYLDRRSPTAFASLLEEQRSAVRAQIDRLTAIDALLAHKQAQLRASEAADGFAVISCRAQPMALSRPITGAWDAADLEALFTHPDADHGRLFNQSYGSMIHTDRLREGAFDRYACFFSCLPDSCAAEAAFCRPAGRYLRARVRGDWSRLPDTYRAMFAHAAAHGLTLSGYAYEEGLNEMAISSMEEYVTEILIRCE